MAMEPAATLPLICDGEEEVELSWCREGGMTVSTMLTKFAIEDVQKKGSGLT